MTTVTLVSYGTHSDNQSVTTTVPTGSHYAQLRILNVSGADDIPPPLHPSVSIVVNSTQYLLKKLPDFGTDGDHIAELLPVFGGDTLQLDIVRSDNDPYH